MHNSRRTAAIAAVLVGNLILAAPVAAVDTSPPALVDVTLSTSAVAVSGLDFETVTVSVQLTDDVGVVPTTDMGGGEWPFVVLSRPDGKLDVRHLELASGTPLDGVWTGEVLVPSTYDGSWRVSQVGAMDDAFNELVVDPADEGLDVTLDVTGTHQPRLSFGFDPKPGIVGKPIEAKGRLTYADTGEPIPNQVLFAGHDNTCVESFGGRRIVTNANGYYRYFLQDTVNQALECIFLIAPAPATGAHFDWYTVARIIARGDFPQMRYRVSAVPARTAVQVGGRIRIDGQVWPGRSTVRIYLQRLTRNGWRVESYALLRANSRYTIYARPPGVGTFGYRVVKPSDLPNSLKGVSLTFVLRGT
jgi:hypothetical protein